ncbi:hypothetical protein ACJMK2_024637 [Sinanodonta woodiana]|uniref:HTH CENPB-type domain-containing protein n=1 Tax=Sinanodonta woodiana TaxID=1069815 RepID=A0ABD3XEG3_SINWO
MNNTMEPPEWNQSPELKEALKTVLRFEIQTLLERLSSVGEESLLLTADITDHRCNHMSAGKGLIFAQEGDLSHFKEKFLHFCTGHNNGIDFPVKTEPVWEAEDSFTEEHIAMETNNAVNVSKNSSERKNSIETIVSNDYQDEFGTKQYTPNQRIKGTQDFCLDLDHPSESFAAEISTITMADLSNYHQKIKQSRLQRKTSPMGQNNGGHHNIVHTHVSSPVSPPVYSYGQIVPVTSLTPYNDVSEDVLRHYRNSFDKTDNSKPKEKDTESGDKPSINSANLSRNLKGHHLNTLSQTEKSSNINFGPIRRCKRHDLTISQKIDVINELGKGKPQILLAKMYGVSQAQISRISLQREKILSQFKNYNHSRRRMREGAAYDVQVALYQWFFNEKKDSQYVNGPILMKKAAELATKLGYQSFSPSNGWLQRWKEKFDIAWSKSSVCSMRRMRPDVLPNN